MSIPILLCAALASVDVSIVEPAAGGIYDGDWLTLRAIVENDNLLPDSVVFSLNGDPFVPIPRLVTDWPTYMQSNLHHGFSESPAPMTNDVLWTAPVTGGVHEFVNPIVVDGVVYYSSTEGMTLYALDAATGSILWSYPTAGSDDPPSFSNGRLYLASDSLYCIDAITGTRVWTFPGDVNVGGTPCVMNGRVVCATDVEYPVYDTTVFCLDTEDGQLIWERSLDGSIGNCIAGWNGMFFVGTRDKGAALSALDAATGDVIWSNPVAENGYHDSSPVIVDGKIYIGGMDDYVHKFDALTGSLEWMTYLAGPVESTPAVFEGTVICGHIAGVLAALEMSNGSIVWSIPASIHGSPAVADGVVFWGGFSEPYDLIYAADASTGGIIWEYYPDPGNIGLQSTPAIVDGVMYFASTDYNLYAFGTGLKWTYRDDLYADLGSNVLIVDSWSGGVVVASDTTFFTVTQTGLEPALEPVPGAIRNLAGSPNPFSSAATISFDMPEAGHASLQVIDLAGRLVSMLESGFMVAGTHSVIWNGTTRSGERVSPGCYLVRFTSGGEASSIKLLFVAE